MDISMLLFPLNDKQREAVAAPIGNYLVLAGAGSGKTRVLTHRVAWLIGVEEVAAGQIMAVTFTNKAAAEMRLRITQTLQETGCASNLFGMWVGTFHSFAHRILRNYYNDAGLPQDFQILDSEDQLRLVKRLMKLHQYDEKIYPHKQACWFINHHKEEGRRPADLEQTKNPYERAWIEIYRLYQQACDRAGLVDFSELLLRVYELFKRNTLILEHYRQRFTHILVDEFQDTNFIQYEWIKLLAGEKGKVMIVGDDDQSIYGWRGARIENIQHFLQDFSQVQTIRLEQNYRSTGNILKSANQLIAYNEDRLGKELWTADGDGEPVGIYAAFNDIDEALFVSNAIQAWQSQGGLLRECAILYRSNSQSRILEDALIRTQIPYRIYGGLRFFERQEIKDALAYLRLIANPNDDAAFERVINTPARGIGERTLDCLRNLTRERQLTLWQALHVALNEQLLPNRAATSLLRFAELIASLVDNTQGKSLVEQTDYVIQHSGLYAMYEKEKGDKGEVRIENLEELVNAAKEFIKSEDAEGLSDLVAFLTQASLEAGEGQATTDQDCVQMMTLHTAKGLEFARVFIVGMEEGLFPNIRSVEEAGRLAEERRLAYVGITRAKQQLTLCYAEIRRQYGKEELHRRSRFIDELPTACLREIRLRGKITRAYNCNAVGSIPPASSDQTWKLGQKIKHAKFGIGTIINVEGIDEHTRLQIAFQGEGIKWLMAKLAKLEKI